MPHTATISLLARLTGGSLIVVRAFPIPALMGWGSIGALGPTSESFTCDRTHPQSAPVDPILTPGPYRLSREGEEAGSPRFHRRDRDLSGR